MEKIKNWFKQPLTKRDVLYARNLLSVLAIFNLANTLITLRTGWSTGAVVHLASTLFSIGIVVIYAIYYKSMKEEV